MIPKRVPVLIVGGGPCGMLLSTLLSRYHVPSLLIEKGGAAPMSHPRAHVLNARSMEILRKIGLENAINEEAPPREDWSAFRYCETLLGSKGSFKLADFAFVDHTKTEEYRQILQNSPCRVTQISQPILERHLRRAALQNHKGPNGGEILFNHEVAEVDLHNRRVHIKGDIVRVVEPDIIIAADGARSLVRDKVGISLDGKMFLESFASVHFSSEELGRRLRNARKSAMLTFVFNPDVIAAVVVAHDARGKGNFVAHLPFFPPAETAQQFEDKSMLYPLLERALSSSEGYPPFQIESVRSWGMHATLATRMSAMDGLVGLLGDAAHQYPPSGGFGVNVGMGEADYLATRIAEKFHSKQRLQSAVAEYDRVRHPIAKETLKVALDNYNRGLIPAKALGLERNAVSSLSQLSQYLPSGTRVMRSLARIPVGIAIKQTQAVKRLREAVEVDFKALPLFFPQVDLGQDLLEGKLVDGAKLGTEHRVGRLLRHAWLWSESEKRTLASQDLSNPFLGKGEKPVLWTVFCRGQDLAEVQAKTKQKGGSAIRFVAVLTTENEPMDSTNRDVICVVDRSGNTFFSANEDSVLAVTASADGFVTDVLFR